jgi:hypothetical protein
MSDKILLALQFYEGDKELACKVARLIADLEPRHSDKADFLFVSRFDCSQDMDTIGYVARKFNVHHYINRQRGTMWPHGPNSQWFGTMDYVFSYSEAKRIPPYKAVLTFEADACPLAPNWISELSQFWDGAKKKVVGPLLLAPGEHINGNAMFSGDKAFLKWVSRDIGGCSPHMGWDYVLAPQFKKAGWSDCPKMRSWWKTPTSDYETFEKLSAQGAVFLHGVKDDSMIRHVRRRFIG